MSSKNILCCGCSWTAGSNPRDENGIPLWTKPSTRDGPMVCDFFPLWPEVLAEKLNMGYVNLGCGGRGNEWIYNRIVDNWNGEKIIIVLWTTWDRWDFWKETFILNEFFEDERSLSSTGKTWARRKMVQDALMKADFVSAKYNFEKSMRWIYSLQNFCKINNIKYVHGQAFYPTRMAKSWSGYQKFIENKIHDYIDEEHFIGWPIFSKFCGFTMSDKLDEVDPDRTELRMNEHNTHPNEKGHRLIAQTFYQYYRDLYGE